MLFSLGRQSYRFTLYFLLVTSCLINNFTNSWHFFRKKIHESSGDFFSIKKVQSDSLSIFFEFSETHLLLIKWWRSRKTAATKLSFPKSCSFLFSGLSEILTQFRRVFWIVVLLKNGFRFQLCVVHRQEGWRKRYCGQMKTCCWTVKQDAELILSQFMYGVRRWNCE